VVAVPEDAVWHVVARAEALVGAGPEDDEHGWWMSGVVEAKSKMFVWNKVAVWSA
jgi:hypothetical protein